jgi:diguanylate cyclase (GGDEF)-like protein
VRARDVVARYGGEEIAVILPDTSREDAVGLAESIRSAIEAGGIVTASIGIAAGAAQELPEALVHAADAAMYKAKAAGRNRVATA